MNTNLEQLCFNLLQFKAQEDEARARRIEAETEIASTLVT